MSKYLSPGVYIEEVSAGPKPIAGVPTSTAAFLGRAERGPVHAPVRLTSWNDYVDRYGGWLDEGFLPESVFGFFENGGSACFVVRSEDGAEATRWAVRGSSGDTVFHAFASSPGAWGERLRLRVAPDADRGGGAFYGSPLTAGVTVEDGEAVHVEVASTSGAEPGMTVRLRSRDGSAEVDAEITEIEDGALTLLPRDDGTFAAGESWVFGLAPAGDDRISLSTGKGIRRGDVVAAELPDGSRRTGLVIEARSRGMRLDLTLADELSAAIPGAQFAPVRRWWKADKRMAGASMSHGGIHFVESHAPPSSRGGDRARVVASGLEAGFSAGSYGFEESVGAGEALLIRSTVWLFRFEEEVSLSSPTLPELAGRYSFVPVGMELELVGNDGATVVRIRRTGGGFTLESGDLDDDFDLVRAALEPDALTDGILVHSAEPPSAGQRVEIGGEIVAIESVSSPEGAPSDLYLVVLAEDLDPGTSLEPGHFLLWAWQTTRVQPLRFRVRVEKVDGGDVVDSEEFGDLGLHPDHPRYFAGDGVINEVSRYLTVGELLEESGLDATHLPAGALHDRDGQDGTFTDAALRSGLEALEAVEEPALVASPDALLLEDDLSRAAALNRVVSHCEKMNRFAVLDLPDTGDDQALLDFRLQYLDSTYAAAYAPFLKILNPRPKASRRVIEVPPSGYVLGTFARTDRERGVHKAPANEALRGVVGLARDYTRERQDALNPRSVNLVRQFMGRGIRIWGARNLTDDTQWRYVNVRRLFLFVENSIERGTQWVVFEPNNANTWLRVRVSAENFLDQLWRAGALQGSSPDEAYMVRCGLGTTMTQTDIDLGLLIVEVAIAAVRPAEFVVFRISHKAPSE